MNLLDIVNNKDQLEGRFVITSTKSGQEPVIVASENIVVDNARTILRDLVFGDSQTITKLVLGDLNFVEGSAWDDPNPATGTENTLLHQLESVPVTSKTKIVALS